ncbi:MAG TPA: lytic transglycosylase domain-containing protein [Stellaceae bacterium]|nr:lytic transglycosylase domain-containing protein [Stellaceae bacterium]
MSRNIAAEVDALIRENASNSELVPFADRRRHPVKVVRGKTAAPGSTVEAPVRRPTGGDVQVVSFANPSEQPVTVLRGMQVAPVDLPLEIIARNPRRDLFAPASATDLDRVAFAVDGAESSHGADPEMWRPEPGAPQGPMQVSAAAAEDLGGGDRFDLTENRQLGRAYLARLYSRYDNWPDAVAAYNWGPGNMDAWIAHGRSHAGFPLEVERYRDRVLSDGAVMQAPGAAPRGASRGSQMP